MLSSRRARTFDMRRWLRTAAAKAFVVALLGVLVTPMVQACPMPMTEVSMAYATGEMPDACAGLAKGACLVSYVQADRVTGGDGTRTAVHPSAAVLRVPTPLFIAFVARDGGSGGVTLHSGAPPPRLLFCRMLE